MKVIRLNNLKMSTIKNYIDSGILEYYVLGLTDKQETEEVENKAQLHHEVQLEIDQIAGALVQFSQTIAPVPSATVRTSIFGTIDFMERKKLGEDDFFPPILNNKSKISDYNFWILKPEMQLAADYIDSYAKIIASNKTATTMIVWLTTVAPPEVHHNQFERFLVIEGSCEISIGTAINYLKKGDYIEIPLHSTHHLKVTSTIPCKVILQRVAA